VWKYSEGVEHVTKDRIKAILSFLLLIFIGWIGETILQVYFNEVSTKPANTAKASKKQKPVNT
jgi:hypothetical protein